MNLQKTPVCVLVALAQSQAIDMTSVLCTESKANKSEQIMFRSNGTCRPSKWIAT